MPTESYEPGTRAWLYGESLYGERGKIHAALRLLLQERISTAKCRELIGDLVNMRPAALEAPWGELGWNPANDPSEIRRVVLEGERGEDYEALKARLIADGLWRE